MRVAKRKDSHAAVRRFNQSEARKPKPEHRRRTANEHARFERSLMLASRRYQRKQRDPELERRHNESVAQRQAKRFRKTIERRYCEKVVISRDPKTGSRPIPMPAGVMAAIARLIGKR